MGRVEGEAMMRLGTAAFSWTALFELTGLLHTNLHAGSRVHGGIGRERRGRGGARLGGG
eukprot:COSAG02_NODE_326_length_24603_cov_123.455681_19_plen_59_part_00